MVKYRRIFALVALGFSSVAATMAAAEPMRQEPQIVRWQVELADGTRAKLMSPLGETNQVTRGDGTVIAFTPEKDARTGGIVLRVYDVSSKAGTREERRLLGTVALDEKAGGSALQVGGVTITPGTAAPKPVSSGAMTGIPLSNRVIRWELTLADGRTVRLAAQEGGMARVKMADGESFGLVPVLHGDSGGAIDFRLFSVSRTKDSRVAMRPVESFTLEEGGDYFPSAWAGSLIRLSNARIFAAGEPGALEKLVTTPEGPLDQGCCVSCGGVRACGCAVTMDCGDCCMPPCCFEAY